MKALVRSRPFFQSIFLYEKRVDSTLHEEGFRTVRETFVRGLPQESGEG